MSVNEFIAAAEKADPLLIGESEKDKKEIAKLVNESESLANDLKTLDSKLTPLTYLYSNSPSSADVSLYARLHPSLVSTPASQHPSQPAVLRYFLHIQSLAPVQSAQSALPNSFPSLDIDVASLPAPERKAPAPKVKKQAATGGVSGVGGVAEAVTAAATAVTSAAGAAVEAVKDAVVGDKPKEKKKEKKEKVAKPVVVKEEPTGPLPSMIDMRVGKVLDVKRHPDADSLYVESIDVGEAEPRTVCSGLVKYMSEEQIRGATIIVICNLKPVTMRGVKSFAMLLCASNEGKTGVEFVLPPAGSQPGDRIYFEGGKYENAQPEAQLNPKKKVFETIQPGFITLDNLDAAWVDPETKSVHRIRTKGGVCKATSFVGASLS